MAKLTNFYEFLSENSAKQLYPRRLIKSIYFDNQTFSSYNDSIEGVLPRKKIRIRNYPNMNKKFNLEIKINSIEGRFKTVEKNINHNDFLKKGYFDTEYDLCFPVLEINYLREYISVFNLRITLDTSISYKKFNDKRSIPLMESAIVEVKSNNLENFNYIEDKIHFPTTRFSKYCNAIDELNII